MTDFVVDPVGYVRELAALAGDPSPPHPGGPDTQVLREWTSRWDPVERALRLAGAALGMASAIASLDPPQRSDLWRTRDEFQHQLAMLGRRPFALDAAVVVKS